MSAKNKKSLEIEPHWLQTVDIPQDKLLGAVFCYGHKDDPISSDFQQPNIFWIYVSERERMKPDILANIDDNRLVELLGPGTCDYVLIMECNYKYKYKSHEKNPFSTAFNLLAPGGILYFPAGLKKILNTAVEKLNKMGIMHSYEMNITDLLDQNLDLIKTTYGFSSYVISPGDIVSFIK